jgi:Branched-chain polyamine synthase A C-terminal domain
MSTDERRAAASAGLAGREASDASGAGPQAGGPALHVDALAELVAARRPDSRRLRRLVALLTGEPLDLAALVQRSALSRRTVEEVIAAAAGDLVRRGAAMRIRPEAAAAYRERFCTGQLARTETADPLAGRLAAAAPVVASMAKLIAMSPRPRTELDHVQATPETAVRRALWLDSTYDLAGSVVLCVGDHDLTSLALCQVNHGTSVVVVDLHEPTLEFIDDQAVRLGLRVRCLFCDLRFGLPEPALGCADLVFTDPPYTPEGVGLFVARGLQGLGNHDNGRVIVAYGYSDRHPALGLQAQAAAHRLSLTYEAVLPGFNRYDGAQAVGSASDLYVWRPTSRTWRGLGRIGSDPGAGLYTRGPQALEKGPPAGDAALRATRRFAAEAGLPVRALVGDRWRGAGESAVRLRLPTLLTGGLPPNVTRGGAFAVLADLPEDPGPWLMRTLLAANAGLVFALVRNSHPDLGSAQAQTGLADLVRAKYRLRFLRGQPDARHAIVAAEAVDPQSLPRPARLAQWLLLRAHGKVGNVWRDGLVQVSGELPSGPLTKRGARAAVAAAAGAQALDAPLIALPRHQIARLLTAAAASAAALR